MGWLRGRVGWKQMGLALLGLVALCVVLLYLGGPELLDRIANRTYLPRPYTVSPEARKVHDELFVADLHSDALMWRRDVLRRSQRGHVDVPRMIEGNEALQIFAAVTQVPFEGNLDKTPDRFDAMIPLTFFQGWPASTWFSRYQRAMHQAGRLEKAAQFSEGKLTLIRTSEDLARFCARRKQEHRIAAGILAAEGMQCLEGDLENVRVLYNAGFRVMGLVHFNDNDAGGSAHGIGKGGLTPFGQRTVQFIERLKMIVDLAHASPQLIDDVLDTATRPVIISHTGLQGNYDSPRTLDDARAKRIAEAGGLIGIGFWKHVLGGKDAGSIVRAIRYAVDTVGVEHVALGSDFDGAMVEVFDVTGLPLITEGLLNAGMSQADIAKVMGGNVRDFFLAQLPTEQDAPGLVARPE